MKSGDATIKELIGICQIDEWNTGAMLQLPYTKEGKRVIWGEERTMEAQEGRVFETLRQIMRQEPNPPFSPAEMVRMFTVATAKLGVLGHVQEGIGE
jgi:hypothetical protein